MTVRMDKATGSRPPDHPPRAPALDDGQLRRQLAEQVARLCPGWLRDRMDDIVQAGWLRLRKASPIDEGHPGPGASLIARTAYCAMIDEIRRCRRRREVPVNDTEESFPSADGDPESGTRAREIALGIRECLMRLLDPRRMAVTLYLQGHTGPETAAILGWPFKRAENMIYRGLADLRRCLAGKGLTP